uniref:Dolichol phosphate-mannose biosynthesis regulatory protein n=1 Tax=Strongyloides stercoralis TaxID=6248 RepID=A0A0K0EQL1_STRER
MIRLKSFYQYFGYVFAAISAILTLIFVLWMVVLPLFDSNFFLHQLLPPQKYGLQFLCFLGFVQLSIIGVGTIYYFFKEKKF